MLLLKRHLLGIDWVWLTEWEKLFVVIDSFARICSLFECCRLKVSSLGRSHCGVVENLETRIITAIWVTVHVLDVKCLGYGMFVVVTGLDPRNHWLLLWHATLMLTVFRWDHRSWLPLQNVFVQPRPQQPTSAIRLGYIRYIRLSRRGCATCPSLTVFSNRVLHQAGALVRFLITSSTLVVENLLLCWPLFLTHILLHAVLVKFQVQSIWCEVLLRSISHGLAVVRFGLLACPILLLRCLTLIHYFKNIYIY